MPIEETRKNRKLSTRIRDLRDTEHRFEDTDSRTRVTTQKTCRYVDVAHAILYETS